MLSFPPWFHSTEAIERLESLALLRSYYRLPVGLRRQILLLVRALAKGEATQ